MATSPSGGHAREARFPAVPHAGGAGALPGGFTWTNAGADEGASLDEGAAGSDPVRPVGAATLQAFWTRAMTPRVSRLLRPAGIEESIGLCVLAVALLLVLAHRVLT